jgi:putative transposase
VLVSFAYFVACRLFALVLLLARGDCSKELELLVLRHELSVLRRQARRPQLTESDRLLLAALSRLIPRRTWHVFFITPETLLRWHRRIVARRWTYPHRPPGRPPLDQAVRELILRLARENGHWGYVRIVGELRKLGITVSATLVRNVLARAGIPPEPERAASNWRSFLRRHGHTILACDFFTVDTVWLRRLPARPRPPRLRPPLQPAAPSPGARPATVRSQSPNRSSAYRDRSSATGQAARPPRRPAPRIRSRRIRSSLCTSRVARSRS